MAPFLFSLIKFYSILRTMKALFILSFLLLTISCNSEKKLVKVQGNTMGTYYKVTTYSEKSSEELKKEIDKFLKFFNLVFSTYIEESEISKINNSKFDKIKISDTMNKALDISNEISLKTKGYFDITVGPLVNAWGFGPDGKQKQPTDKEIAKLLSYIGHHKIKVEDGRLVKEHIETYIDMSAMAKGLGVDELVKYLEFGGHSDLLVEIGGEVRARGKKSDGSIWRIGIEGPSENLGSKIIQVVELNNLSLATSGSYRNFIKYGDKVFQHTIDPKTGYPAEHKTISVSVITEYCADADAWATALMSMGIEKGLELANRNEIKALFQIKDGNDVKIVKTKEFQKLFK